MQNKVNIGVIGTGRMGSVHTRNLVRRIPQANVVAVCDIRLEVAQDVADELGIQRVIHDFDMARFQMGDVEEVYAMGNVLLAPEIGSAGDVDTAVVTLRFKNGALGVIDNCRKATYGYDQRLEVLGSNGAVMVENEMSDTIVHADHDGFHSTTLPHFFMQRYAEAYVSEMRQFVECVACDKTPPVTGRDGRLAVVLGYAALKSRQENRPVRLSEIAAV
jgi:myo-inositol 2-dehydrogenase/D-chiro-inositol 1-dehydrogenase